MRCNLAPGCIFKRCQALPKETPFPFFSGTPFFWTPCFLFPGSIAKGSSSKSGCQVHLPTFHANLSRVTSPANFSCQVVGAHDVPRVRRQGQGVEASIPGIPYTHIAHTAEVRGLWGSTVLAYTRHRAANRAVRVVRSGTWNPPLWTTLALSRRGFPKWFILPERLLALVRPAFDLVLQRFEV